MSLGLSAQSVTYHVEKSSKSNLSSVIPSASSSNTKYPGVTTRPRIPAHEGRETYGSGSVSFEKTSRLGMTMQHEMEMRPSMIQIGTTPQQDIYPPTPVNQNRSINQSPSISPSQQSFTSIPINSPA